MKDILEKIKNQIIVSVQAESSEPLYEEKCLAAMMKSVVNGGAKGLRLAGARDIKNAKKDFDIPVIGITKPDPLPENWKEIVYITPTVEKVKEIIDAGADIIAFDGTSRHRECENLLEIISFIKSKNKLAMADISTYEEGVMCRLLGADIISTTLSGYTQNSISTSSEPDFGLLEHLVDTLDCPIILEGRVWAEEHVKKGFDIGAHSIVIGSAITRPHLITKKFVNEISK